MKNDYIIFLIICILFSGCNSHTKHVAEDAMEFHTIDFEKSFETEKQMLISEIADTVEYLELKTPEDIIITRIYQLKQFEDNLIVISRGAVYLFCRNGQFLRQIGNIGQGPGEYPYAFDVEIDAKKKEIVVTDGMQLLFYNFDGYFLRKQKLDSEYIINMDISDSILWSGQMISSERDKYYAVAYSLNSECDTIIAHIHNPHYIEDGNPRGDHVATGEMFYHNNGFLYFKGEMFNNTIWKISGINAEPYAFINLGKYKMPLEFEPWNSSIEVFFQHCEKYWCVSSLVEDDNYFYLLSENRKQSKINSIRKYIVYDKKIKQGFAANDDNGIGITDDIHGGPPIWPLWTSDEYYINAIELYELLEKVESGEYFPSTQLKELISRIGEDSNQLIVLCRKKK